jgi:hypothetical protein
LSTFSHTLFEAKDKFEGEYLDINLEKIMSKNREQRVVIPPCISQGPLNLAGPLHEIPRKSDKILPNFDPDRPGSP